MMRYFRLYSHFIRFSFTKALEFRLDFVFRFLMDTSFYIIDFLFFELIYNFTPILGGWQKEQLYLFIPTYLFIDAFRMTVVANSLWWLPKHINSGQIDYYLTKPVSSLFFLSFKDFDFSSLLNLFLTIFLFGYFFLTSTINFEVLNIALYFLFMINALIVIYLIQLSCLIPVFWTGSPRGFMELFHSLAYLWERPTQIFPYVLRRVFYSVIPLAMVATFPCQVLFGEYQVVDIVKSLFVTILIAFFVILFWKLGLKKYTSASS